jgi:hypothetical protein
VVGYSAAEGKAIIGLVDLLLKLVKRTEDLPPQGLLSQNVETAIRKVEEVIGPGATSQLRMFLGKCISELGLKPSPSATQWIPFRKHALYQADGWEAPKSHAVPVFYLQVESSKKIRLYLPLSYYYARVVGFNVDRLSEESIELGFTLLGKDQEPHADLRVHNDQDFFDAVFALVARTARELEATLQQQ